MARGKKIPNVADVVGTSLDKGNELDALAKLPAERQAELIEKAKAGERVSARNLTKDRKQPGHKIAAPVTPEQTAEDRKALYGTEEEPDIPVCPDRRTATGAPALPLSVSAPSVARPADTLPPPAATSLPPEPGERSSRKQSDPAFDLPCEAPGEMNLRRVINNVGARAVWQSMVTAFGIPAIYRVMTEEQKNEFSDLINAEVEAQNA